MTNLFLLDGKPVNFYEFLRDKGIGQMPLGSSDPVYRALLALNPGDSYQGDGWTLEMRPYEGSYADDNRELQRLAHKPVLTAEDKAELRRVREKITAYLQAPS